MKNACLGAGWGGSGIAVGFSWFGERSGGMKLVERDVGERGFVEKWREKGKECLMKETGVTREQGKGKKSYGRSLRLDCWSHLPEGHTLARVGFLVHARITNVTQIAIQ